MFLGAKFAVTDLGIFHRLEQLGSEQITGEELTIALIGLQAVYDLVIK
jgi:hypothetical protein